MTIARNPGYLKIGDVAGLVGVSPSVLRSWEKLGLVRPHRTRSQYRLYTLRDVKLLKRARFLCRVRGLNAPAVVHLLQNQGLLGLPRQDTSSPPGPRLRSLRRQRGLPLAVVAKAAGISVSFLSALERGQVSASVATLRKLARFFNLNLLAFFNPSEANPRLVRPPERKVLEAGPGVRMELLGWGNVLMEPHLFRIEPGTGSGESYAHEGEEFLYILRGQLQITLDGAETYQLRQGDSFYFESTIPHRWVNPGKTEGWVLWVNTPLTF